MYACFLRLIMKKADTSARIPMSPKATPTPTPILAPELIPDEAVDECIGPAVEDEALVGELVVDDVCEAEELEVLAAVDVGLGKM